jgi:hypothetical protein
MNDIFIEIYKKEEVSEEEFLKLLELHDWDFRKSEEQDYEEGEKEHLIIHDIMRTHYGFRDIYNKFMENKKQEASCEKNI